MSSSPAEAGGDSVVAGMEKKLQTGALTHVMTAPVDVARLFDDSHENAVWASFAGDSLLGFFGQPLNLTLRRRA